MELDKYFMGLQVANIGKWESRLVSSFNICCWGEDGGFSRFCEVTCSAFKSWLMHYDFMP